MPVVTPKVTAEVCRINVATADQCAAEKHQTPDRLFFALKDARTLNASGREAKISLFAPSVSLRPVSVDEHGVTNSTHAPAQSFATRAPIRRTTRAVAATTNMAST